ncbi:60S ribosomal protein L35, L29 [Recurvomyces mirabilis]|uniref:60S ribosomal protein L35, L29 n=1 Tax=Recurvomyces mirabilis TaxID=574656 RepID=UPI002DDE655A|nr:60S ribosomal protein L35, L29 [Recurvomyces mirabilis]
MGYVQQSSSKIKTQALWGKNKDELKKQLDEQKQELVQLRTQKIAGGAQSKLNKMCVYTINPTKNHDVRKNIARILTVINHTQRHQLRIFYEKKKYMPLDLRPKLTRAKRRALSPKEASLVSEKQKKRQRHFPQRNYAVKLTK